METVVVLPTPESRVNADALSKAESLLEMVRSGEIESFISAAFRPQGTWVMMFSGQIDTLAKIGALEAMKADLLESLNV